MKNIIETGNFPRELLSKWEDLNENEKVTLPIYQNTGNINVNPLLRKHVFLKEESVKIKSWFKPEDQRAFDYTNIKSTFEKENEYGGSTTYYRILKEDIEIGWVVNITHMYFLHDLPNKYNNYKKYDEFYQLYYVDDNKAYFRKLEVKNKTAAYKIEKEFIEQNKELINAYKEYKEVS